MTKNNILLKKFNYPSNAPNFVYVSFIFKLNFVCLPVYIIITNALPVAILTPRHIVFYKFKPNVYS
jgi:hypothetical protein